MFQCYCLKTAKDKFKSQSEGIVPNRIMIWQFDPPKKILSIDEQLPMKATKDTWSGTISDRQLSAAEGMKSSA